MRLRYLVSTDRGMTLLLVVSGESVGFGQERSIVLVIGGTEAAIVVRPGLYFDFSGT